MEKHHYVECHVIVSNDPAADSAVYAKGHGWWASRLGVDTSGEEQRGDLILTTRRSTSGEAVGAIRALAADLRERGFDVTRGKTEIVAFDTKYGDDLLG